jgi:nucleoside-diphosphate kinase
MSDDMERTLILLKPDAVQRRLCGELIGRLERKGLALVGMKLLHITPELSKKHYAEHVTKSFYAGLEAFVTSGPAVAIVVEGPQAVKMVRTMMGATNGRKAAPGTIRGDFGLSQQMNLIHGSDSPASAAREIALYFAPGELTNPAKPLNHTVGLDEEFGAITEPE